MCLYYKIITQSPLDASFGNSFRQNNAVRYCPYNGLLAWSVNNGNCSRDFAVKPVSLAENKYIWDDTKKRKKKSRYQRENWGTFETLKRTYEKY